MTGGVDRSTGEPRIVDPPGTTRPYQVSPIATEPVSLVDLLDRVLARGVVASGELTLTIADVDLVHISLRALLSSVRPDLFRPDLAPPKPTTVLAEPTGPAEADS